MEALKVFEAQVPNLISTTLYTSADTSYETNTNAREKKEMSLGVGRWEGL